MLPSIFLSDIDVWVPEPDHSEVPADWWDFDADKSLLIGVFKHGKGKVRLVGSFSVSAAWLVLFIDFPWQLYPSHSPVALYVT